MKRIAAAILLGCSSLAAFAQAPCPAPTNSGAIASSNWSYNIQAADLRRQLLRVRMTIAPTSPELRVQLPVWNAVYQVRDFAEHVNWLRATDAEGKAIAVRKLDKTTWSAPNAATVEYEIAAIDTGPFGAELTPEHLFLNLAEVLIYPIGVPKQLVRVELTELPSAWKVASPMNREGNGFCSESYDRMVDSPIEASEFRVIEFELEGAKYSAIVDADANDYDEAAIKNMLRKVVAAETDWMQDRPFDRYMFLYHFSKEYGRGGMEHAYATAIESSATRMQQEPLALASVSAHEFFHLWNVKRIRSQALEPIDYTKENYTRTLWFSEGFTNTVAEYMLVRSGLADERIFLDRLSSQIKTLETRPAVRTQSAEESSLDAWLEKYPYYRAPERSVSYYDAGQIIGVLLDLEMRRVTDGKKSLRDLFQYMNAEYAKKGKYFDDQNGVREAVEEVTGKNFEEFFRRTVSSTELLPYDLFESVGLKLERVPSKAADAGFTAAMNFGPTPVVIATSPGSEAEKAGLRTGDTILSVNGREPSGNVVDQIGAMDPGSTVKLKVRSRSGTREVKYKLAQKSDVDYTFSELPDASVAKKARRAAWIRGDNEGTD